MIRIVQLTEAVPGGEGGGWRRGRGDVRRSSCRAGPGGGQAAYTHAVHVGHHRLLLDGLDVNRRLLSSFVGEVSPGLTVGHLLLPPVAHVARPVLGLPGQPLLLLELPAKFHIRL